MIQMVTCVAYEYERKVTTDWCEKITTRGTMPMVILVLNIARVLIARAQGMTEKEQVRNEMRL